MHLKVFFFFFFQTHICEPSKQIFRHDDIDIAAIVRSMNLNNQHATLCYFDARTTLFVLLFRYFSFVVAEQI